MYTFIQIALTLVTVLYIAIMLFGTILIGFFITCNKETKSKCKMEGLNYAKGTYKEFLSAINTFDHAFTIIRDDLYYRKDSSYWNLSEDTVILNNVGFLFKNPIDYLKYLNWKGKQIYKYKEPDNLIDNPWWRK